MKSLNASTSNTVSVIMQIQDVKENRVCISEIADSVKMKELYVLTNAERSDKRWNIKSEMKY